jgi:AraC-like DNA-binding protein
MMHSVLLIMSLCGFSLGIMACTVLVFTNKTHHHANRLLAIALFSISMVMLLTFFSGWDPGLYALMYRFPSPLSYLIMPASYLYLRAVIRDETKFRTRDLIHFFPAAIHFVEMLPFYLKPLAEKKEALARVISNPDNMLRLDEGLLPSYYHTILRSVLGVIYLVLMIRLLSGASKMREGRWHISHSNCFRWLMVYTCLLALSIIPMLSIVLFPSMGFMSRTELLLSTIGISFIIINFFLYFQPEILYGIPRTGLSVPLTREAIGPANNLSEMIQETEQIEQENDDTSELPLPTHSDDPHSALAYLAPYKPILELFIANAKPFLNQGYTILDLSRETGIPQHHLSALLNRIYGMRFNEFMNRMRIDYIADNFGAEGWENLTLEGIAKQAGFSSRTTFFNTIKKTQGLAPTEFIDKIRSAKKLDGPAPLTGKLSEG